MTKEQAEALMLYARRCAEVAAHIAIHRDGRSVEDAMFEAPEKFEVLSMCDDA